jgi:hypothetical protein
MAAFFDYMIQHVLYIKGVEKCIRHQTDFAHKEPTECAFGEMFYSILKPNLDRYPKDKRALIEQMEQIHIQFHDAVRHIQPNDPDMEKYQQNAWYYSSRLINLLDRLEKMGN